MEMCLNERAIDGSYTDRDKALTLLHSLSVNTFHSKVMRNKKQPLRTEDFKNRIILNGKTVQEFFYELKKSKIPEERKISLFMLQNLMKSPYIKDYSGLKSLDDKQGVCYLNSSSHHVVDNLLIRFLLSPNTVNSEELELNSDISSYKLVNLFSEAQIKSKTWIYEESTKHKIPKDIFVDGNVWSSMKLSQLKAQEALTNSIGIKGKRCTYSFYQGSWFQFYNHQANIYHGFPIGDNGNNGDLNKIKKFIGINYLWDSGQIIIN